MTKAEDRQRRLNERLQGHYVYYGDLYLGVCRSVTILSAPSGANAMYTVSLHDGTNFDCTNSRKLRAVSVQERSKMLNA